MHVRILLAAGVVALCAPMVAQAANIFEEWDSVKAPPPPKVEDVSVDSKTTALLILDFNAPICEPEKNARCAAAANAAEKLLKEARAKGAFVAYSLGGGRPATDIIPQLKPVGAEPVVASSSDKFFNTDLEKILKDKGIKTIVATGVASNGAALFTATAAVRRDFAVVVPMDATSAGSPYAEQLTAWQLANSPGQVGKIKVTLSSKVKFE